jgi:alkanesulfonate monooxygenase SsuD/methylene tetrahydromethanopterin reductase-like flavin-dependent oxidoreductase (luciferase family)
MPVSALASSANRPWTIGMILNDPSEAAIAGSMDLDAVWVGGHVLAPFPTPEPVSSLALAAASLPRVPVIGTATVPLPLYNPALLAKQVAEVDRFSAGRIVLGVGVGGEFEQEFRACGADPRRRGPPIVVTGRSAAAQTRAAHNGDGWMPYLCSPAWYRRSVYEVSAVASRADRVLDSFLWAVFVFVSVADTDDDALRQAVETLGDAYGESIVPKVHRLTVSGTAEHVARRLGEFAEAGAQHIAIAPCGAERTRTLEAIAEHLLPRLP